MSTTSKTRPFGLEFLEEMPAPEKGTWGATATTVQTTVKPGGGNPDQPDKGGHD